MRYGNGNNFIATVYNIPLAADLCNKLFSIIMLMNSGHTYHFHKGICTVFFGDNQYNAETLSHSVQT